jgi:hypothetical protein
MPRLSTKNRRIPENFRASPSLAETPTDDSVLPTGPSSAAGVRPGSDRGQTPEQELPRPTRAHESNLDP